MPRNERVGTMPHRLLKVRSRTSLFVENRMQEEKESFVEKVIAQWPGALGLVSTAIGLYIIWQVHEGGRNSGNRAGLVFIVIGMAAFGYWALANRNDKYNF